MKDFKLDNEPKITSGFTPTEIYFTDFSTKVMQQLPKEEPKVISFWARNRTWIYSSAAIIVITLSVFMVNLLATDTEEIHAAEIENYLTYHSNITDDEIAEYLDESDISNIEIESDIDDETIEQVLYDQADLEHQIIN